MSIHDQIMSVLKGSRKGLKSYEIQQRILLATATNVKLRDVHNTLEDLLEQRKIKSDTVVRTSLGGFPVYEGVYFV